MTTWNSGTMSQFSAPQRPHRNPRKHAPGKARTRWSKCKHRFNPITTNRYNTQDTDPNSTNKINIIQPTPKRACQCNDGLCTYCKYKAPHPSPVPLDWSSEDWDGEKAKAREQKSLVNYVPPKQDTDPPVTEVITDDIPFLKLTIRSDGPDENPAEVTDTLIPPLEVAAVIPAIKTLEAEIKASATDTAKSHNSIDTHYETLLGQELRMQREEEKYALFTSILDTGDESISETDTNNNTYTYFD